MGTLHRSGVVKRSNDSARLILSTIIGMVFGYFIGVSFPSVALSKINLPSSLISSFDMAFNDGHHTSDGRTFPENLGSGNTPLTPKIYVPTNPHGAESLPPGIVVSESDFYLRRLWGEPSEDLKRKPKYLVTFTVGLNQKNNINAAVKKFSEDFQIMLFHYDGRTSEWDQFEWSQRAIHVSVRKQTKWWYAKRFLHPDVVAAYDYIFIWDEDLGVEHFNAEKYIELVKKHVLEISQPGLEPNNGLTWQMTKRRGDRDVHKDTEEKPGWCSDPHLPPCAAFVEIMAPVFSREAWRCVWHMIQNDLVHGWGLDFALRRCVDPAHEKIGVVDSQWIVHQVIPSLGSQVIRDVMFPALGRNYCPSIPRVKIWGKTHGATATCRAWMISTCRAGMEFFSQRRWEEIIFDMSTKSKKDPVYDHCTQVENDEKNKRLKLRCNYCGNQYWGGTIRLKNHLAGTRKDVAACTKCSDDVRAYFIKLLEEYQKKKTIDDFVFVDDDNDDEGKIGEGQCGVKRGLTLSNPSHRTTINTLLKKKQREDVCQSICRCIYANALPFNLVKDPYFKIMVKDIGEYGQDLKPPSYHEARVPMLKKEVDIIKGDLMEKYKTEWKKTGCTIMSDGWTDGCHRSITNFLVNSPRGTIFLRSIDTSSIQKDADQLFLLLDSLVDEIGEVNVVQVVTDSASAYVKAGEMLMDKRKRLFWSPCAAHCIDNMLKDIAELPIHKETVSKAKTITVYIYNHTWVLDLMRTYLGGNLTRAGVTRFATEYLTLRSIGEKKIPT